MFFSRIITHVITGTLLFSPQLLYAFDSSNLTPIQNPQTVPAGSSYLLASGTAQLYCYHDSSGKLAPNPDVPSQYNNWSNCTTPFFANGSNQPVQCSPTTYPVAQVAVVATDACNPPTLGNSCGVPYMIILNPANGKIGTYGNTWFLCFQQAYTLIAGNGWGSCNKSNNANTSLLISYSIYCLPCPTGAGACAALQPDPTFTCPPAYGYQGMANNGVFPRQSNGTAQGWCNATGGGGIGP